MKRSTQSTALGGVGGRKAGTPLDGRRCRAAQPSPAQPSPARLCVLSWFLAALPCLFFGPVRTPQRRFSVSRQEKMGVTPLAPQKRTLTGKVKYFFPALGPPPAGPQIESRTHTMPARKKIEKRSVSQQTQNTHAPSAFSSAGRGKKFWRRASPAVPARSPVLHDDPRLERLEHVVQGQPHGVAPNERRGQRGAHCRQALVQLLGGGGGGRGGGRDYGVENRANWPTTNTRWCCEVRRAQNSGGSSRQAGSPFRGSEKPRTNRALVYAAPCFRDISEIFPRYFRDISKMFPRI